MTYVDFIRNMYYIAEEYDSIEIVFSDKPGTVVSVDLENKVMQGAETPQNFEIDIIRDDAEENKTIRNLPYFGDVISQFWVMIESIDAEWDFLF